MHTIIELPTFTTDARLILSVGEHGEFYAWLAANPLAGDVIPGSGDLRQVGAR